MRACSLCHYPNGKGRPENAGVSGLPVAYFIQTMADFKNGRKRAPTRARPTRLMIAIAKAMTDEEIEGGRRVLRRDEVDAVDQGRRGEHGAEDAHRGRHVPQLEGEETEPIGQRIIEMPDDAERTELLRDPRSGFIAYVPVGSIKKGEALVKTGGNGKTTRARSATARI